MYTDDLSNTKWMGEIVDVDDPDKEGKVRIKVWGKFDKIDTKYIPWARPAYIEKSGSESGGGSFSPPKLKSIVEVEFDNGDIYHPKYKHIFKLSDELKDKLSKDNNYENAQILVYDTELNIFIYYIKDSDGVIIRTGKDEDSGSNQIIIKDDNTIQLKNANDTEVTIDDNRIRCKFNGSNVLDISDKGLSLGSESKSAEPGVLGDKNADAHDATIDEIDGILGHLIQFATTQSAATKNPMLAPLTAGFDALLIGMNIMKGKIASVKAKVPLTKSKKITLD